MQITTKLVKFKYFAIYRVDDTGQYYRANIECDDPLTAESAIDYLCEEHNTEIDLRVFRKTYPTWKGKYQGAPLRI